MLKTRKKEEFYRSSLYLTFLDICRSHLIISQFTEKSYGTSVTPTCAFILSEININHDLSYADLAERLRLNRSSISRAISLLIKERYLEKKRSFKLLKRGLEFLKLQDDFNQRQLDLLTANLTNLELKRLATLFTEFADEQLAPIIDLPSLSPRDRLLIAIRRVTRLWEITGSHAFKSDYNALDWLVLSELHYNKLTLSQLAEKINIPLNTLSQRVKSYKDNNLVEFIGNEIDQRSKNIVLSVAGHKALYSIEKKAHDFFAIALDRHSIEYIEDFVELFWKYTLSIARYRSVRFKGSEVYLSKADNQDLEQLRWVFIRYLSSIENTLKYQLTENFFSPQNCNLKITSDSKIIGGLEIVFKEGQILKLVNQVLPVSIQLEKSEILNLISKLLGCSLKIEL